MRYAPVLGLTARLESGWLDVGAGHDKVTLNVAHSERRHRGSIFADKRSARAIMHRTAAPITMPSMMTLLFRASLKEDEERAGPR